MLKKIVSVILVMCLIISLAACSGGGDESVTSTASTTEHTTEKTTENQMNTTAQSTESTTQVPTVKVTIPEGYTLVRISWLLEEKGLCSSDEFIKTAQNYKEWLDLTQYPFLNDMTNAENVCFYLEGYIFPLTYDIPENATVQEIIIKLLNGSKQVFTESLMVSVQNTGYNLHEILTLASLIEKEAKLPEHRSMISSVLYNRLGAGMKFQCDPTVKYCTGVIEYIYPEKIDHFKYYYNTYRCNGLMAGPICNPGMESILAAISPADTEYLYFIIGTVEPYEAKYSKTFEEHQKFWNENKDRLTGGNS